MNKISKFIFKNVGKISLFISLIFGNSDSSIVIVIVLLLLIYLKKYNYNISKIINNFKENKNEDDNEIKNTKLNDDFDLDFKSNNVDEVKTKKDEKVDNTEDVFIDMKKNNDEHKDLKENIKLNHTKINSKDKNDFDNHIVNPYPNNKKNIKLNYSEPPNSHDFLLNVNTSICSTPMFTMRTYNEIDFYFNFILHDYDTKKIHDLIMCKDIHQWMSTSSLSEEDISNELVPIYFCLKNENNINVYEYLKVFISSNGDEKVAFVQKGNDYIIIEKYIELLVEKDIIQDLLSGKLYTSYNLSINEGVSTFLNKFLSLVLISENFIGEKVKLDIENYYENKSTYQYLLNSLNEDTSIFNTTI